MASREAARTAGLSLQLELYIPLGRCVDSHHCKIVLNISFVTRRVTLLTWLWVSVDWDKQASPGLTCG